MKSTTTARALTSVAACLTPPWEPRTSNYAHAVAAKGTKRERHGKVAKARAKNKAARAARKRGRR